MAQWRTAQKAKIQLIDITVKNSRSGFAPTWDLLNRYKDGAINDDHYTSEYRDLLKQRWFIRDGMLKDEVMSLLNSEEPIAFACFCPAGCFCHRHLVVEFFQWKCQQYGIPFEYLGELQ